MFQQTLFLFPQILHLIIRIIRLFVFLYCPTLCLCVCLFFLWCSGPLACVACVSILLVWRPKGKLSLGFFGSLVRALAWCSVGPFTFNRWNRMAWKDFCPCNPHQSVCGFCLFKFKPLSLSLLCHYCLSTLLTSQCSDFSHWPALPRLTRWPVVFLACEIVGWDTASSPSTWWHLWRKPICV